MITANGWCAGGKGGGRSVQSMGEMGKDFCPNFLQPFLEKIDRRSCNDGRRELIPIFHKPHRKCRPSPSAEYIPIDPTKQNTFNKKLKPQWRSEQKQLRGEYLPGDLGVINSLAGQPGGYHLRAVLDWTYKEECTC